MACKLAAWPEDMRQMPWWAWLGLVVLPLWAVLRLLRARKTGQERFGPFLYDRIGDPVGFWSFVIADAFVLIFVGGLCLLVSAREIFHL
jgi:hypothetical protein